MTNQTASVASVLRAIAMTAGILVVFALTGSIGASAKERPAPQPITLASNSFAALEKAFWACDYAGTNGAVDSGMGVVCTELTRELMMKKFNGDIDALIAWWEQHKPAQHSALEAAVERR